MNKEEFIQAKLFIYQDIERELQLANATEKNKNEIENLGINAGGGNFLAALGLLSYTEFFGKLKYNNKKSNGSNSASENFNCFYDELGREYQLFRQSNNVYDIFRCGLAHEYYVKKNCTIVMLYAIQKIFF